MLLTLHLLLNNSTADGEGMKKAGTGCMSPARSKWLSAKPAAASSHLLVADPCFRGSQQRAAAKNSNRSFSQTRYFTFVSNVANLIQTCIWQGQTQYTDVIKSTLSSMCKRNQFFAVSSHTPFLPLTLCYFVWNSHSRLLTPLLSISTACLGQGNREPLTPTRAGAESWKPWKHTPTSHHRLWNNNQWHGWSWRAQSAGQLHSLNWEVPRRISITNSVLHHKITKISLFLDMWDLWSWISHLSLIPSCPPIHNTLHFCSAAFLHKSHKLPAPNTSSPSSLSALLFSTNLSFPALGSLSPHHPKPQARTRKHQGTH